MRDSLLTLWNTWSFFTTYASLNEFDPSDPAVPSRRPLGPRPVDALPLRHGGQCHRGPGRLRAVPRRHGHRRLIDDPSNWFVRRSRRRFWRTDPGADPADSLGAQATLYEVLVTVAHLLAPMCPFLADRMWRDLTDAGRDDSIHLADWPALHPSRRPRSWRTGWTWPVRLSLPGPGGPGRSGHQGAPAPGPGPGVPAAGQPQTPQGMVEDELNVDVVEATWELSDVLTNEPAPNYKLLGPRLKQAGTAAQVGDGRGGRHRRRGGAGEGRPVTVPLPDGPVELTPNEVELRIKAQPGFAVSQDGAEVLALDLVLDAELWKRGLAREVVRKVQDMRKAAGLEVSDWIHLHLVGLDYLDPHFELIAERCWPQ